MTVTSVDNENQKVTGIKIPGGLSFLIDYDFEAPVTGLDAFPRDERPTQVNAIFQFYHIMVSIGMILIGLSLLGCYMWWKGTLFDKKWL